MFQLTIKTMYDIGIENPYESQRESEYQRCSFSVTMTGMVIWAQGQGYRVVGREPACLFQGLKCFCVRGGQNRGWCHRVSGVCPVYLCHRWSQRTCVRVIGSQWEVGLGLGLSLGLSLGSSVCVGGGQRLGFES